MTTWIILIGAYLIGSISSALIVCKLAGINDPRQHGSHNAGATNVLRLGSKRLAIIVLLGDFSKGFLAVQIAKMFLSSPLLTGLTAITVVIGHIFPVFFGFRGGKGVATAAGAIIALSWKLGICVLVAWLATVMISSYSSLGAIVAAGLTPLLSLSLAPDYWAPLSFIGLIILLKHQANIIRLIQGTESKSLKK